LNEDVEKEKNLTWDQMLVMMMMRKKKNKSIYRGRGVQFINDHGGR